MVIPYARQYIEKEEIRAIAKVLKSDMLTQGPVTQEFEKAVAAYCGAKYAVAVSSGTAALHLACLAAGLGPGDFLWTSPNTFVASANCALYCGAQVDFLDIDPRTYNIDVTALAEKLEAAARQDRLPKVVVPVHFAGQSCEMAAIRELADKYGFTIIEDACHALGGSYRGTKVGSCTFSEMTVFSFHPVKIITTGEGGMILTNRKDLCEKLRRLRTHGVTRNPGQMEGEPHGPWYYQQIYLGFNYRVTDIQAALGLAQLQKIQKFLQRRRYLAKRYNEKLKDLPVILPYQHPETESAWHLYVIQVEAARRREIFEHLRAEGILVNVHYIPVHTQPYYKKLGFKTGDFPEAEQYYRGAITLPLHYGLSDKEQDYVIERLQEIIR